VTGRDILTRYRALRRWVERERRRLARTGERPSQRYLRRSRLVADVDPMTLRELVRELRALTLARGRN
jgi:hypothetical protein